MPSSFTVRGRAQGLNPRRSEDHLPTATLTKDHDHGSHEEEEEGEEGSEEVIRTFFRIRKRLDENPAALLLGATVRRYSWRAMLLPSNT
jgi:hypothetical protein